MAAAALLMRILSRVLLVRRGPGGLADRGVCHGVLVGILARSRQDLEDCGEPRDVAVGGVRPDQCGDFTARPAPSSHVTVLVVGSRCCQDVESSAGVRERE